MKANILPAISFNNGIIYALKGQNQSFKTKQIHLNEEDLIIHLHRCIAPADDFFEENSECS
ncbi:MAG TPA: hypothetical protein VGI38_01810 [Puia sp.]|jgi:hypothetical protein